MCGTDLCHLQQVGAGADGIITTCGGFGTPAYHPAEIVLAACGEPFSAHYFCEYLRDKFSAIYRLKA